MNKAVGILCESLADYFLRDNLRHRISSKRNEVIIIVSRDSEVLIFENFINDPSLLIESHLLHRFKSKFNN